MKNFLSKPYSGLMLLGIFYSVVFVLFAVLSEWFLSYDNIMSIVVNMAFIGLMAVAGTPLIVAGGLDLSVAAVAGMSGVVVATLYSYGVPVYLATLGSLVPGVVIGLANGFMTTKIKMNPLIVTLGMMSIVTGVSLILTGGLTQPLLDEGFAYIGSGLFLSLPVPFVIMMLVLVVFWWVMAKTKLGRYIYATGGNPVAAKLSGVPVEKVQMFLYILSGISGSIAGIILVSMLGAAAPDAAGKHLLTVIAAIILGGTSLQGGKGSVWGTLIAILILGTLNNGLTLMDVSSFWQDVVKGGVLLAAVMMDTFRARYD